MKIVYLISNVRKCGPLSVMNKIISNISNCDITVISIFGNRDDNELIDFYHSKGIKYCSLKLTNLSYVTRGKKVLLKKLDEIKPNVVHSHGVIPDLLLCKLDKYYRVTTVHSNIFEDYLNRFGKIKGRAYIFLHVFALKKMDKVVTCAKYISDIFNRKKIKSIYVRNGTDVLIGDDAEIVRRKIRNSLHLKETDILFIYCGSLYAAKQVAELVELFVANRNSNEYLLIVGDGPERKNVEEKANDSVFVVGHKSDAAKYYLASDIYISNSSTEGFSISVMEALCTHNLLLLSNIPSHNECINLNDSIYLGEVFDKFDFKQKKDDILNHVGIFDERIIPYVSSKRMADEYMNIYKQKN